MSEKLYRILEEGEIVPEGAEFRQRGSTDPWGCVAFSGFHLSPSDMEYRIVVSPPQPPITFTGSGVTITIDHNANMRAAAKFIGAIAVMLDGEP